MQAENALGVLLIGFFVCSGVSYYQRDHHLEHLIWSCNLTNLVLALAIWRQSNWWKRTAVLATLGGIPLWLIDEIIHPEWQWHSVFSHLGAGVIGVWIYAKMPVEKKWWWKGFGFMVASQLLARLLTHPEYNINVSYLSYHSDIDFPVFLIGFDITVALQVYLIEKGLNRLIGQFTFNHIHESSHCK